MTGICMPYQNEEGRKAATLIEETLGIDPDPESLLPQSALIRAVETGTVSPGDTILLNITGGGIRGYGKISRCFPLKRLL